MLSASSKLGLSVLFILFIAFFSLSSSVNGSDTIITLRPENTIVLRDEVNTHTVSKMNQLLSTNNSKKIYLYLYSPGGDIESGLSLVSLIKAQISNGREIVCIADYAASMAFSILQSCSKRYIMEDGSIMQHQPTISIKAKLFSFREQMRFTEEMMLKLMSSDAARVGMKLDDYIKRIDNDWWMFGEQAVEEGAADKAVTVICTEALTRMMITDTIQSSYGSVAVSYSGCPIVYEPVNVVYKPAPGVRPEDFNKWLGTQLQKVPPEVNEK